MFNSPCPSKYMSRNKRVAIRLAGTLNISIAVCCVYSFFEPLVIAKPLKVDACQVSSFTLAPEEERKDKYYVQCAGGATTYIFRPASREPLPDLAGRNVSLLILPFAFGSDLVLKIEVGTEIFDGWVAETNWIFMFLLCIPLSIVMFSLGIYAFRHSLR